MVELVGLLVFFPFHLEAVKFYSTFNNIKEIFHLQTILECTMKWLEPFPVFFLLWNISIWGQWHEYFFGFCTNL